MLAHFFVNVRILFSGERFQTEVAREFIGQKSSDEIRNNLQSGKSFLKKLVVNLR